MDHTVDSQVLKDSRFGQALFSEILTYQDSRKGEQVLLAYKGKSDLLALGGGLNWRMPFPHSLNARVDGQLDRMRGASYGSPRLMRIYVKPRNGKWLVNCVFVNKTEGEDLENRFGGQDSYQTREYKIVRNNLSDLLKSGVSFHYPETRSALNLFQNRKESHALLGYKNAVQSVTPEFEEEFSNCTALGIVGVVIHDPKKNKFALVRQNRIGDENLISLAGGKIDKGLTPNEAIVGEAMQETGIPLWLESILGLYYNGKVVNRETGEEKEIVNLIYVARSRDPLDRQTVRTNSEIKKLEILRADEIFRISDEEFRTPDTKLAIKHFLRKNPTLPLDLVELV